jgi:AraC family transcriptional regulator
MREESSSVARAGCLLERAMTLLQTDRAVAWRCLNDAATLLRVESRAPIVATPEVHYHLQSGGLATWQARRTLGYIESNLGSKFGVGELAGLVSLSESHFSRAFRRALGTPPMAYVVVRRVERAKVMMSSTSQSLSDIALSCGFSDQSHFNKAFRRCVGISPGRWRRGNAQPEHRFEAFTAAAP